MTETRIDVARALGIEYCPLVPGSPGISDNAPGAVSVIPGKRVCRILPDQVQGPMQGHLVSLSAGGVSVSASCRLLFSRSRKVSRTEFHHQTAAAKSLELARLRLCCGCWWARWLLPRSTTSDAA